MSTLFRTAAAAATSALLFVSQAHAELQWVPKQSAEKPIVAGRENGHDMYMCQVTYERNGETHLLPGKTWPGYDQCNVGAFDQEMHFYDFKKLVGTEYTWVASQDTSFPANAVIGGHDGHGRQYIACAAVRGGDSVHPGFMNSDTNCNYGYDGHTSNEAHYFVLVTTNSSVPHEEHGQPPDHSFSLAPGQLLGGLLGITVVAAFCAATGGTCVAGLF